MRAGHFSKRKHMGWVRRGAKSYYYKSKRVGGRVKTEVYSGYRAKLEAAADERAPQDRAVKTALLEEGIALESEVDRIFGEIEAVATAELEARGFHRYRRQWRKRRG